MKTIRNLAIDQFDSEGNDRPLKDCFEEKKSDVVEGALHHGTYAHALKLMCEQNRFRLTRFTDLSGDRDELNHIISVVEEVAEKMEGLGRINEDQLRSLLDACEKIRSGSIARYGIYRTKDYTYCVPYVMSFTMNKPDDPMTWMINTFEQKDLFIEIDNVENIIDQQMANRGVKSLGLYRVEYDKQKIVEVIERQLTNIFHEGNMVDVNTLVHLIVEQGIRYKPSRYEDEWEYRLVVMMPLDEIKRRRCDYPDSEELILPCMHGESIGDVIIDNEFGFKTIDEEVPCYLYIDPFTGRLGDQLYIFKNPKKNPLLETPGWSLLYPIERFKNTENGKIFIRTYMLKKEKGNSTECADNP